MNIYRITTFSFGASQSIKVEAPDILSAIHSGHADMTTIVKIEFIDSSNEIDTTDGSY